MPAQPTDTQVGPHRQAPLPALAVPVTRLKSEASVAIVDGRLSVIKRLSRPLVVKLEKPARR